MVAAAVSPSPSLSPTPKLSPKPKSTPKKTTKKETSKEAVSSGEVLGKEESPKPTKKPETKTEIRENSLGKLPFLFIGGGILVLLAANFQVLKPKIKDLIALIKHKSKV